MAKDKYEDYDGTPASNTDVGGINIQGSASIANGDNALREIMSHTADHFAGDTIASASTTDLGSKAAQYLEVTGTTTITAFGTIKAGTVKFLRFSGALTLTYNATSLILTTGASVITVAGDMAIAVSEGSGNWRVAFIRGTAALARGVDLATAATLNLDSVDAPYVALTGTTTVTAVTLTSRRARICRADAAFQMTAGASLIVNGSTTVNYTTVANDLLLFEGYGSSVVRVWVIGRNPNAYLPATAIGAVIASTVGTYATNANLSTTIPLDDTIPQIGEGVQIISVSHTPQNTTNKLRIRFVGEVAGDTSPSVCIAALFINGAADAVRAQHITIPTANYGGTLAFEYEYTPGAASAQTIAVRAGGSTAAATTVRFNGSAAARFFGGAAAAMLTVEEIRA